MPSREQRVMRACAVMNVARGPVSVEALGEHVSVRRLQRDFLDVLGITPRQYGQAVRADEARRALSQNGSVLDAVFESGHGSVRAFYDGAARRLGMTASEYRAGAPGQVLLWSTATSSLGCIVAAVTERGVAAVRLSDIDDALVEIRSEFTNATLARDDVAMADVMTALVALAEGLDAPAVPLDMRGTAFQARVWSALREVPVGDTWTYSQVAEHIGEPTSVRAVARACATNPVALAVPCHRVVRGDGSLAGYRWGLEVKAALLDRERRVT